MTGERVWEVDLTAGAVTNRNIKLDGSQFFLAPFIGGTNEAEAPVRRLKVSFRNGPTAEMWVYGDKKILTPRVGPIGEFFAANNIKDGQPVRLRLTQLAVGELKVERAL